MNIIFSISYTSGYFVNATPPTVLSRSFLNFADVLYMIWRSICGLDIIVQSPLTLLYKYFEAFACVFFIVWRGACGFEIIHTLILAFFFQLVNCQFSASQLYIYYTVGVLGATPLTVLYWSFLTGHVFNHSVKMCMWFRYYCQINFLNNQYWQSTNVRRCLTDRLFLNHICLMGESFQDYSWIQDFEADFP